MKNIWLVSPSNKRKNEAVKVEPEQKFSETKRRKKKKKKEVFSSYWGRVRRRPGKLLGRCGKIGKTVKTVGKCAFGGFYSIVKRKGKQVNVWYGGT